MTATISPLRDIARDLLSASNGESVDAAMAELDWYSLLLPAEYGGVGGALGDALAVLEEISRADAASGFLANAVLTPLLLSCLSDSDRARKVLSELGNGRSTACVVLDGACVPEPRWQLRQQGAGWMLSGDSGPTTGADECDVIVAFVGPFTVALLDRAAVTVNEIGGWGPDRQFRVHVDNASLAAADVADLQPDELAATMSVLAMATAAQLLGSTSRLFELTLNYVATREQFGRSLGAFQAVHMRCADLVRDVDGARVILQRAVAAYDADRADAHCLASMAVAWGADAATRVTQAAHTLHGAIGFTAEYELHRHTKAVLARRLQGGGAQFHRARVARYLSDESPDRSST